MTLFNENPLRDRIESVYRAMKQRAKPKLWKSGKRKGMVRVPGITELPFTKGELWEHVVKQIGPTGVLRCPYCEDIGKPAILIDLTNLVFDHHIPLDRGGTWELSNLRAVCADCNNCKGHLSYEFFVGLMSAVEKWPDAKDRAKFHSCLRTHGVTQRIRFQKKPTSETATQFQTPQQLPLEE